MFRGSESSSFSTTFYKFNLWYHFIAFILIFAVCFYSFLLLAFICPALPLTASLALNTYITLGEHYSTIMYDLDTLLWHVSFIFVIISYFLYYRDTLRRRESRRWLIVLPVLQAYPTPIIAYTVIIYRDYFLKALMGEKVFISYHWPGAMESIMVLLFIGLFIAIAYTAINVYMHVRLVKQLSYMMNQYRSSSLSRAINF